MDKVQIVVLAAGKSKRMLTDDPKALTPLKGKPFLKHLLETIEGLNMPIPPVIVLGHKRERVLEELGETYNYAHQKEQLGTGHALASARSKVHKEHQTVLVLSTDQPHLSKETILNLLKTHLEKKPAITIATVKLPDFKDWRAGLSHLGRIIRDQDGKVEKNIEYRDATEEEKQITEINPAIYAFNAKWLWDNIEKIKNENVQKEYYLTDLLHLAREQGREVKAVPVTNILEGLQPNTKEELETLERLL